MFRKGPDDLGCFQQAAGYLDAAKVQQTESILLDSSIKDLLKHCTHMQPLSS